MKPAPETLAPRAQVIASLAQYGFLLADRDRWTKETLGPEELFIHAIEHYRSPRMVSGQVVALYNADVDCQKLTRTILYHGCQNRAGFILSKIARVWREKNADPKKIADLEQTIEALRARRTREVKLACFIPGIDEMEKLESLLAEQQNDEDAQTWAVYGNIPDQELAKYFDNFVSGNEQREQ